MYQCFVTNEWEQIQSTAELQLGGKIGSHLFQPNDKVNLMSLSCRRITGTCLLVFRTDITTRADGIVEMCCHW